MRFNLFLREIFFLLFAGYFVQGWLYENGSFLSQALIAIIIFISGIYMVKTMLLDDEKNIFFIAWTLFILINMLAFFFDPDLGEGRPRNAIKNALGCLLPFYPFYYFARKGDLKAGHLIRFALLILPVMIVQYFLNLENFMIEYNRESDQVVNNLSYSFVALIPFVFLFRNGRIFAWAFLSVILFFIIQGSKRGAILAAFIGLMIFLYYQFKTIPGRYRLSGTLGILFLLSSLALLVYYTSSNNEFMLYRLEMMLDGDTSNRLYLYDSILTNWFNSDSIINLLFGYGLAGSVELSGSLAHNDWLEVLSNFGIAGVLSYGFLFIAAYRVIRDCGWMPEKKLVMLAMVVMWLFISLISMWYVSLNYFTNSILFGYLLGSRGKAII